MIRLSAAPLPKLFRRAACHAAFVVALMGALPAWAAEPEWLVRSWQMEDGLPDSSVTAVAQTTDGYLWVGTDNGLARFDGVNFKPFNSQNTPALRSDLILCLLADRQGRLWIGTAGGGLALFAQGRFQNIDSPIKLQTNDTISNLLEDAGENIWAVTADEGLVRVLAGTNAVAAGGSAPVVKFELSAFTTDSTGRVWAASAAGLFAFDHGRLTKVSATPDIKVMTRRQDGGVWIAATNWLRSRTPDGLFGDPIACPWVKEPADILPMAMCEDRDGGLWVGTYANGLVRRSRDGEWHYVVEEGPLFQNVINCIFEDREGSIWVGTENGGLHRLKQRTVTTLPLPPAARDTTAQSVWATRDGSIWIGTSGAGVFRYRDGQFTHFANAEGLTDLHVFMVLEDSRTNLWAATRDGLFLYEAGRFKKAERFGPIPGWVMCLFEDREKRLWIGTDHSGVACISDGHATWFTNGLAGLDVRSIAEDNQSDIWVGTAGGGLFRITNSQVTQYGKADGLDSKMIVALLADADGTLWIGTFQNGLIRMKNGRFTDFTTRDGLANNIAGHLADDGLGNLWVSSVRGLMRISKAALNSYQPGKGRPLPCLTLTGWDGMFTTPCSGGSDPAMAWDAGGRLLVPNMKAIAMVDMQALPPAGPVQVVFEDVLVNGQSRQPMTNGELRVQSGQNRVEFHYTTMNLANAENTRFRVKLDGWDDGPVDMGFHRQASYGTLPPGEYHFRVMASRRDGQWDEVPQPLTLRIVPRFWETWWFRIGSGTAIIIFIAGSVYLTARRRARRRLERLERIHALERERVRIARDIHDELGAGLAQIGLLADLGGGDLADKAEIHRSFTGIAQRARSVVTSLDEIVWAVNPSNDNLTRLADYLCRLAEEAFENSPVRCLKDVPTNLPPVPIRAETRHNLTMAVREAMTNTLKHAGAKNIWLRLKWDDPELMITVEDDGRGFDAAAVSERGNGLVNQRARLKKIGGNLELKSSPAQGTRTIFHVRLASENRQTE